MARRRLIPQVIFSCFTLWSMMCRPASSASHLVRRYAELGHEHQRVIGEVRELVDRLALVPRVGGDYDLGALLADLLEYLVEALLEEVARVAPLGAASPSGRAAARRGPARRRAPGSSARHELVEEAALRAGVAGGAELVHPDLERVVVAVGGDADHLLAVPAGLALAPELPAAAAPEAGVALARALSPGSRGSCTPASAACRCPRPLRRPG